MFEFVVLQLLVLLVAAAVLAVEARTGRMEGATEGATLARALVFLLAAVAGATLLIALADSEWLFALALAPITMLSLLRFTMLARRWWAGWRLPVLTGALLGLGVLISVPWMPYPLDRAFVIREIHGVEAVPAPDTIDPEALRPVRA
ncbi:MAG TPA: hypothetical protein VK002_11260 [Rubricoccaceae bacterium]|nr:hypothetical protein [Rubricoccaceae bacterium]